MNKHALFAPVFIARRDHEVYFVRVDDRECRSRAMHSRRIECRKRAERALCELHPGYSDLCAFDARVLRAANASWLMVTVMRRADLDEYRALYPFRPLVTVSSALAARPDFSELPARRYGDEIVGYSDDHEGHEGPISVPVADDASRARFPESALPRVRRVRRSTVFANPVVARARVLAACAAVILLSLAVPSIGTAFLANHDGPRSRAALHGSADGAIDPAASAAFVASAEEIVSVPDCLSVLLDISRAVISTGGTMDRFSYDGNARDTVRVDAHGCDALAFKTAIGRIPYLAPQPIEHVEYREGIPFFSLAAETSETEELAHTARSSIANAGPGPLDADFFSFASIARALSASLDPGGTNSLSYSSPAEGTPRLLRTIAEESAKAGLSVNGIAISADRKNRSFKFDCTVVPAERQINPVVDDYRDVLLATGMVAKSAIARGPDLSARVGSIRDTSGTVISFYRNGDGKIFETGE